MGKSMRNLEKILGNLGEILMKSGENHGEIMRKSWGNIWGFFGKSLANRCKSWDIGGVSGGYLRGIWGMS